MGLGALTIVEDKAGVGPLKVTRFTVVGDGSYPTGGSTGLEALLRAASGERRRVLSVQPAGANGDSHLEFEPRGPEMAATAAAATDLVSTGAVLHGLSAGDPVRFFKKSTGDADQPDAALPAGIVEDTVYFVIAGGLTTTAFKVSATSGGAAIDLTSNGTSFIVQKEDRLLVRVMSTAAETANATNLSGNTYKGLALSI